MARRVKHPDIVVARIKAAAGLGIPLKVVARMAGVSWLTARDYVGGQCREDVQPDPMMGESLLALFRGET